MCKRLIFVVAMVMACASGFAQARQWTLDDCITYALENNISLKKNVLSVRSANEDLQQSQAALLPSLSFGTSHSVGYSPFAASDISGSSRKGYYNDNYSFSANWTVWDGNKLRNQVKMNQLNESGAVLDSAITANNIQETLAQYYIQALYLKEAIGVAENSLEVSRANEERGRGFVEVGNMSKADLAQLTAQRSQDEYTVVETRSSLTTCLMHLKQLLELPGDTDFDVIDINATDEQALEPVPALATVYDNALLNRPEIKRSMIAIESGKLQEKIARAGSLPSIGLTAGAGTGYNTLNDDRWATQFKNNVDMSLGLRVSIPICDQRSTKTAVNKARIQQQQAQLDLLDSQKTLYATVENYWEQAITSQQKFRAALTNVESVQASFDLLEQQFNLGLKNIVELMTGKSNLLQALQNKLQSKYTTILNLQMLKFYQKQ